MKITLISIFIFILLPSISLANPLKTESKEESIEKPFTTPETPAKFPGGEDELIKFISENLHFTDEMKSLKIEGKVILRFTIRESGEVDSIHILRSLSPLMDEEAIRVVKLFPKWIPAKFDTKIVKCYFVLPISFKLNPNIK